MKLSDYARKVGVSDQTAWRWWQKGHLTGYQLTEGNNYHYRRRGEKKR